MERTNRAPVEKLNRAREGVPRAVGINQHKAMVNADGHHLAYAKIPTRRREIVVDVEVDIIVCLIPESRVVGEGQREINSAARQ